MAKRVLAFVLGGGGARGALQAGALRALLEAGLKPDLLVGTSIGACNAAYLALRGLTRDANEELAQVWRDAAVASLLPPNYLWQTMRAMFGRRARTYSEARLRAFWLDHGISSDLRFGQLPGPRLVMVASDLNTGQLMLYGSDPEHNVFEGLLASTALPPWVRPIRHGDRLLVDGGVLSTLPIEPALAQGATDIIALDLTDPLSSTLVAASGWRPGMQKLSWSVQQRQIEMEQNLAAAHGVPVQRIQLRASPSVPVWDFSRTEELMATGYDLARSALARRQQPGTWTRFWTARDWLARSTARMAARRKAA